MKTRILLAIAIFSVALVGELRAEETQYVDAKKWNFVGQTDQSVQLNMDNTVTTYEGVALYNSTNSICEDLIFQRISSSYYFRVRNEAGKTQGLFAFSNSDAYWGLKNVKTGQRLVIQSSGTVSEIKSGATLNAELSAKDSCVYDITSEDGLVIFKMIKMDTYMKSITLQAPDDMVIEPILSLTAVDGENRIITITTDTPEAEIKYALNGAEEYLTYTAPISINDTTAIAAYAEKNGKQSDVVNGTFDAGTAITLNLPVISLYRINGNEQTYSVAIDNSQLLLSPVATLTYTLPNGTTGEYSDPLLITDNGYLYIDATAEGYTSTRDSVYVDTNLNWTKVKSWDFVNFASETIDRMVADSLWNVAYQADGTTIKSLTRPSQPWIWEDSTAVAEFEGLSFAYNSMLINLNADRTAAGLANQSGGDRNVTVNGLIQGQYVEFVLGGESYFYAASGTSCSYSQKRYGSGPALTAINVYLPGLVINDKSQLITVGLANNLQIDYDPSIDIVQKADLKVLNDAVLNRVFGDKYETIAFPFIPTAIVCEGDTLNIGDDFKLKEWTASTLEFTDATRIIANSRGYVIKMNSEWVGKTISFISNVGNYTQGITQSTYGAVTSGATLRTNRLLVQQEMPGITYALNAEGTAFVKTTDAVYAPYTSFFMVADDAVFNNDQILIEGSNTGLSAADAKQNFRVFATKGAINIIAEEAPVAIYSIDGVLVKETVVSGSETIQLLPGMYLVNGEKVMVW